MNIGTLTIGWADLIIGTFCLSVWLAYDGSLVVDLARYIASLLKEKTK